MHRLHYNDRLKRRAESRLKRVGDVFADSLAGKIVEWTDAPMAFGITFDDTVNIPWIQCTYAEQNRFLSRSYDFVCRTELPSSGETEIDIELKYDGLMQITDCRFEARSGHEAARLLLEQLNRRGARDIVREIDFLSMTLAYSPEQQCWRIESRTMIGSSTWAILPPAFQTITPSREECHALLDTFDLIAYTIRSYRPEA